MKQQRKQATKIRGVSKAKMNNIRNLKRQMRRERTPGEQKARREKRKAQRRMAYAEEKLQRARPKQKQTPKQAPGMMKKDSNEITGVWRPGFFFFFFLGGGGINI